MRRTVPVLVGALLALALVAAGCGDDDQPDRAATTAASTGTPATGAPRGRFEDIPRIVRQLGGSVLAVETGSGEGSGVAWAADLVVTNQHVVGDSREVRLHLGTGQERDAVVLAADERYDLAVLRVRDGKLRPATFAEQLPERGELAVAMGNPLGFENSVTGGIVSGLDRSIPSGGQTPALVGLLQTDAAISPGNSGGALVNGVGEVIGINVAYIPPQAGSVSLGFAIPSPTVRRAVRDLVEDGRVHEAYLGVSLAPLTPELAATLGFETDGGAVVVTVSPGGPAARGELRRGDVITRVGDRRIEAVEDVYAALREHQPGDEVEVEVLRESGRATLRIRLGERPSTPR